jgi:hypothetical protein
MEEMDLVACLFSACVNWTREAWIVSELMRKNGKQWSMLRILRERMVRMVRLHNRERAMNGERKPPQWWKFPHKSACILGDTWLSRSSFLSTWSLFLSPKELRITGFISQL